MNGTASILQIFYPFLLLSLHDCQQVARFNLIIIGYYYLPMKNNNNNNLANNILELNLMPSLIQS